MTYTTAYGHSTRVRAHQTGGQRPVGAPRAASVKQVETVANMRGRKVISARAADALCRWDDGDHSAALASTILDELFAAAWAPRPAEVKAAANPVTEVGMYRTEDGTLYRAQAARTGDRNLYAKRLVISPVTEWTYGEDSDGEGAETPVLDEDGQPTYRASFEYAAGAIRSLTADMLLTVAQAQEIGRHFKICIRCGAVLEDALSIERGQGRTCFGKS